MSAQTYATLAEVVLVFHLSVVLFNVIGLIVVPVGAWRGWAFVRIWWWRALHVAILALVAGQAVLQEVCFLTLWQSELLRRAGQAGSDAPFIARLVNRLLFWPLPLWVFAIAYVAVCILVLSLWFLVPPQRRGSGAAPAAATK
jgi:uncharacterized protein DUF2784